MSLLVQQVFKTCCMSDAYYVWISNVELSYSSWMGDPRLEKGHLGTSHSWWVPSDTIKVSEVIRKRLQWLLGSKNGLYSIVCLGTVDARLQKF